MATGYGHVNDDCYPTLIISDPKINNGEPTVRGTRVPVRTLLASLAEGAWVDELLADFPTLAEEHLRAVIAYAASVAMTDLPLRDVPVQPDSQRRTAGLHKGAMRTSVDFNNPLPDELWLGGK